MIRTLVLWVCLATPLWATQDGWPALYDVEGVAADDALNIRAAPSAASDILGTLKPDAADIEVIKDNDGQGTWGLINTGEATGWVSLAFMARQAGQLDGQIPNIRQCFGTEPFWSLRYDAPRVFFEAPDQATRSGLVSGLFRAAGRRDRFAYTGSFLPDGTGEQRLTATVGVEACSDGMSDRSYGLSINLLLSDSASPGLNGLYSGCCSIAPPAK